MMASIPATITQRLTFCLLFACTYGLHIWVHPNHFTTYDSWQYLGLAEQIARGSWFPGIEGLNSLGRPFNPYGPAYPYAIALSSLGGWIPFLWASKLLNLGLVVAAIWKLTRNPDFNLAGLLPLFTAQFFFITAHTWSEAFLIGIALNLASLSLAGKRFTPGFLLLSVLAALARLQGIFLVLGACLAGWLGKAFSNGRATGILLTCLGLVIAFSGVESIRSGMLTGGGRPGQSVTIQDFVSQVVGEGIKSFIWVQKSGQPGILSLALGFSALGALAYSQWEKRKGVVGKEGLSGDMLTSMGLFYAFSSLPILYYFSFAEGIDQRFLAPGLLLLQAGLLGGGFKTSLRPAVALGLCLALALLNLPWTGIMRLAGTL